ncbi:MAG: HAMP domain-containing histidine kinase [Planctomycetia bacterium]|nr:HAMP domain-containing histidine kinase [Planctomycetia bacterium]
MPDGAQPADDPKLTELKLRALAEFAAGAGHEINNPVATIVGYAQQLLAGETDPDRRHALATIGAQALRIRDMIGDVMLFARPPQPRPERLDMAAVLREVIGKLSNEFRDAAVQVHINAPSQALVLADPVQLRIVISSLLRNALEALTKGGQVTVTIDPIQESGRRWTRMAIADDGSGLSAIEREHLFDPFFSGRQAGRGLGFGLPKAWRIVTMHGGRIEVETPATGGVKITVHWPAESE